MTATSETDPVGNLIDFLPASIVAVIITHLGEDAEPYIWPVAQAMADGRLPYLKQVVIEDALDTTAVTVVHARDAATQAGWPWRNVREDPENRAWMRLDVNCDHEDAATRAAMRAAMMEACSAARDELKALQWRLFPDWTVYLADEVV